MRRQARQRERSSYPFASQWLGRKYIPTGGKLLQDFFDRLICVIFLGFMQS